MEAFIVANMAPLMFGALVIFLLLGYPVAFALAANGMVFGLIGIEYGLLKPELLQAMPMPVLLKMDCEFGARFDFWLNSALLLKKN